jgi:hypothetical protein
VVKQILQGWTNHFGIDWLSQWYSSPHLLLTKAIGVVIVVVAIAWFKAIKPDYIVYLNSSSGESQALTSPKINNILTM